MGTIGNGRFYARGFHLYDRNSDGIRKALRRIRKEPDLCDQSLESLLHGGEAENNRGGRRTRSRANGRSGRDEQRRLLRQQRQNARAQSRKRDDVISEK